MALLISCQVGLFPNIKLERQLIYFSLKIKICRISVQSRAKFWFFNLGLVGWMGPASTWQLLASVSWGGIGWNQIVMFSLSQAIVALYVIESHSASYISAANKGCLTHTLCLLVLIIIMGIALAFGIAMHQLNTMPSCRMWCSACSIRHVVLGGNLLVCPGMVIVEFPGIQIGCCLLPIVTWPINPSFLRKDHLTFFSEVSRSPGGRLDVLISLVINRLHSKIKLFWNLSIMETDKAAGIGVD